MPQNEIELETQRLQLEKEKLSLEEKWKKRTFIWSVLSALLTASLTITIAIITSGTKKEIAPKISSISIEECLNNIKRVKTISLLEDQTVPNLAQAIQGLEGQCNGVLSSAIKELKK